MPAQILHIPKAFVKPFFDPREQAVTTDSIIDAQAASIEELQRIVRMLSREMSELLAAHHHIVTTTEGRDYMRGVSLEAIARTDRHMAAEGTKS